VQYRGSDSEDRPRSTKNVAISLSIRNPPQFCSSPPKGTCHPFARRCSGPPFRPTMNGHRLHLPYMATSSDDGGYSRVQRARLVTEERDARRGVLCLVVNVVEEVKKKKAALSWFASALVSGPEVVRVRVGKAYRTAPPRAGYDDSHFSIAPLRLPSLHRASRRTHPYDIPPPPRSACLPPADGHGRLDGLSRVLSQIPSSTPHILSLDSRAEFVISSSNSRRKRRLSKRRMALSHLPPSFLRQGRRRLDVCRCSSSTRWIDSPSDSRPGVLPYFGLVMARRDTSLFRFQAMYLLYTSRCRSLFLTCVMGFG
jgi:hypothetical protein